MISDLWLTMMNYDILWGWVGSHCCRHVVGWRIIAERFSSTLLSLRCEVQRAYCSPAALLPCFRLQELMQLSPHRKKKKHCRPGRPELLQTPQATWTTWDSWDADGSNVWQSCSQNVSKLCTTKHYGNFKISMEGALIETYTRKCGSYQVIQVSIRIT